MREINRHKLWYLGLSRVKNGVGSLVEKDLPNQVVEVRVRVTVT